MRAWILCFSLGTFCAGFIPFLPDRTVLFAFLLPLLCSFWLKSLRLAGAFCIGIFCLLCHAVAHKATIIPHHLEQQMLWVSGIVVGLPQKEHGNANSTGSSRIIFQADLICEELILADCRVSPNTQPQRKLLLNDFSATTYLPGQLWHLKVNLKRPHGFSNPGGFDYERWLFQEKISATGYIREDPQNTLISQELKWFNLTIIDSFRAKIQQSLKSLPLESSGFIAALMIGDRYLITDQQWDLLSVTGTNHLMVISGLHIGLVAWLVFTLTFHLCKNSSTLCLSISISRLAAVIALLAAVFYAALAGFSLPVQRALVMVCCLMSGQLLVRQVSAVNNLCWALFLVLLLDPLAAQNAGFWLSFFAVFVLILFFRGNKGVENNTLFSRIIAMLQCQLSLFLGMLPLMWLFFGQVSLLAPAVNMLAIPFIGFVVVPLCLFSLVMFTVNSALFFELVTTTDFLLGLYSEVLSRLSGTRDFLLISFPAVPLWLITLMLVMIIVQFFYHSLVTRFAGVLIVVYSFFYQGSRPAMGEFTLDVLDVGQGLASVIVTKNHLLLYDTGPAYSPRFNAGSGIVQPFLNSRNYGIPDLIVVSHGDNDHAGGLASLSALFPTSPVRSGEILSTVNAISTPCLAGQQWTWDQVQFEFLHPVHKEKGITGNNASCVLKVSTGQYSVLMPGDIELESELSLLAIAREQLSSEILIAPHHGSLTSSTGLFIRAVDSSYVVFSSGYLNRFNHPHPQVRERYLRAKTTILETSESGAIRFHLSAQKGIESIEKHRVSQPRLWQQL